MKIQFFPENLSSRGVALRKVCSIVAFAVLLSAAPGAAAPKDTTQPHESKADEAHVDAAEGSQTIVQTDAAKPQDAVAPKAEIPPDTVVIPQAAADNAPHGSALAPPLTSTKQGGRYQAIALPRDPGTAGDKMMILDTQTGDVWQWFDSPALSQYIGRTGLTYMGKLKPGTKPGETITFKRFDAEGK